MRAVKALGVDFGLLTETKLTGGIYTRTIDGFAEVNDMTACVVPRDI